MADEKTTTPPDTSKLNDVAPAETSLSEKGAVPPSKPAPQFQADAFLSGKKGDKARVDTAKAATPTVVKRGGIGFFTAFLMSSLAAGGGAYLALFANARPDLLQKAGIAAFVPQAATTPSLGTSSTNIEPLTARVSALEAEVLALQSKLGGVAPATAPGPTAPSPTAAGPTASGETKAVTAPQTGTATPAAQPSAPAVAALPISPTADGGALTRELAGISGRVTAIETRLAALDPTGAGGAIVAGLQADIAGMKAIIAALQQQAAAAPSPSVTFAVINLAEAATRPGPFLVELDTVRAAMPNAPEVATLEPFARTGVPTRTLLQERFAALQLAGAAQATTQAAAQKDTSMMSWFKRLFAGMVKVQSAPDAQGSGADAVLLRAKTKLDQGDLAGSADELATIPSPSALVTDWANSARKRLALESAISALRGAVGRSVIVPTNTVAVPLGTALAPSPVPATKTQGTNP